LVQSPAQVINTPHASAEGRVLVELAERFLESLVSQKEQIAKPHQQVIVKGRVTVSSIDLQVLGDMTYRSRKGFKPLLRIKEKLVVLVQEGGDGEGHTGTL
jgi:hypothetical protein